MSNIVTPDFTKKPANDSGLKFDEIVNRNVLELHRVTLISNITAIDNRIAHIAALKLEEDTLWRNRNMLQNELNIAFATIGDYQFGGGDCGGGDAA